MFPAMNFSYYPSDPTFNNGTIPFSTLDTQNGLDLHESSASQPQITASGTASNQFSGRQEASPIMSQSLWSTENGGPAYSVDDQRYASGPDLTGSIY